MMEVEKLETFEAKIWVGFREKYSGRYNGMHELEKICQEYVDDVSLCVTINPTEFVYTGGNEPGAWIGLINYPRFPNSKENLKQKAFKLANIVMKSFNQFRVTIVTTDGTYMLTNNDLLKKEKDGKLLGN